MPKTNPLYTYETLVLDLATARNGVEYSFSGNFIKVIDASDINANIDVAFNSSGHDAINLKKGRGIRADVLKWYLTNSAQAGKTVTLLIATDDSLQIFDDGVVGDIDTIQEVVEPVAINHLPDKILSDQGLTLTTAKIATTSNVGGANTVIYTVPANKIFYLESLDIAPNTFAGSHSPRDWRLYDATPTLRDYLGSAMYTFDGTYGGMLISSPLYFKPFIKLVAAETLRLYNAATCTNTLYGIVRGYLKDA